MIADTRKIMETFHMTKVTFLHHFCSWALTFSFQKIFEHIAILLDLRDVTSSRQR